MTTEAETGPDLEAALDAFGASAMRVKAERDGLFVAIAAAQDVLAEYIVPDSGISEMDCVNALLGILDHRDLVVLMRSIRGADPIRA